VYKARSCQALLTSPTTAPGTKHTLSINRQHASGKSIWHQRHAPSLTFSLTLQPWEPHLHINMI